MDATVLKEILRNCGEYGDRPVYQWIDEKCDVADDITYRELAAKSADLAVELQRRLHLSPEDRVVLCYCSGPEFAIALIACSRAGVTAGKDLLTSVSKIDELLFNVSFTILFWLSCCY